MTAGLAKAVGSDFTLYSEGFLALLLPVFILASILGGFATPTEAAAIAVAYALFVGGGAAVVRGLGAATA